MTSEKGRFCSIKTMAWTLSLGAFLFSIWRFPECEYFIKIFSNLFITGRSSSKVYLFVIFLFLLWKIFYSKKVFKKDIFLFHAIVTALLFLLGLFEFFSFYEAFYGRNPAFLSNIITAHNPPTSFSTTLLFHSHNAKAVGGYLFSLLQGTRDFYALDSGTVFLDFYPAALLFLHLCLYAFYLVLSALLLFSLKEKLGIKGYFGFGLALLVITKNLIDGGILNYETWLFGLPVYLFFLFRGAAREEAPRRRALTSTLFFLKMALFFYASHAILVWLVGSPRSWALSNYLSSLLRYSLAFVVMTGVDFLDRQKQKKRAGKETLLFLAGLLGFCFLFEVVPHAHVTNYYRIKNFSFSKGDMVLAAVFNPQAVESLVRKNKARVIQKTSVEHYLKFKLRLEEATTYYDLCREIGINPNLGPVATWSAPCDEKIPAFFEQECWITPFLGEKEINLPDGFYAKLFAPQDKRNINGRDFFKQTIRMGLPRCTPIAATARLNLMGAAGIQKAICHRHPLKSLRVSEKQLMAEEAE